MGVHPKTVSRALKRGAAPASTKKRRVRKLDDYKPTVDRLLSEGVWHPEGTRITTVMAGEESKVSFIVNELGYSRRFHFWCTDSQDAEHTYEGIIRSFEYFDGTAEEVLVGVLGAKGRKPTLSPKMRVNPIIRSEFGLFSA